MIVFPNAKINIGLNIVEKRADGFHDLETVFYPVPWKDCLEIIESKELKFEMEGLTIDSQPKDNLCIRAYKLLSAEFDLPPVHIFLLKNIPAGAGLGGGSSDASFMLKLLNDHFRLSISNKQLQQYALQLGSDCPFFIENIPVFASGRGDRFREIELDLSSFFILIIYPGIHVSTPWAFRQITPRRANLDLIGAIGQPVSKWREIIANDFEEPVMNNFPKIRNVKEKMYDQGAIYAAMSGSGSAVFGIFTTSPDPEGFLHSLEIKREHLFVGKLESNLYR